VTIQDGGTALNTVVYIVGDNQLTHAAHEGSYSLDGVPPGLRGVGAARPGYMLSSRVEAEVLPGEIARENLTLVPIPAGAVGNVSGMAILGNPGPEAGVLVALVERFSSTRYTGVTDKNGRFEIPDVPAGYYEFMASHQGYRTVGLPNLEVRPDQELTLPTVILPPQDSGTPSRPGDSDPNGNLDDDGDGRPDTGDNCPVIPNPSQEDSDADGVGNACETGINPNDTDGDYVPSNRDNCPDAFNPYQENHDDDPLGDACDPDDDNDGILDDLDTCQYIADPNNNPELCNWASQLVYSGQDPQTGDIHLYHLAMKPQGQRVTQLTTAKGQAWGAWAMRDAVTTWVYFHYRDHDLDHFKICRIDLNQALELPVEDLQSHCFNWGYDAMNPAVCGGVIFYDWFMGDHWIIRGVEPAELSMGGKNLQFQNQPMFPRTTFSYRYASCRETGGVNIEFGFDVDCNRISAALDWDFWTGHFTIPINWWLTSNMPFLAEEGVHDLRSTPGPPGSWIIEREVGDRADIVMQDMQGSWQKIVADGSLNREPAFLSLNAEMGTGLLAYQSDLRGSFDVYVRDFGSSSVMRITAGEGWEGSPAWVPLP
jgi:nitrous oxide reductase accessory protein NosL